MRNAKNETIYIFIHNVTPEDIEYEDLDEDTSWVVSDSGDEWDEDDYFEDGVDAEAAADERADHYRKLGFKVEIRVNGMKT